MTESKDAYAEAEAKLVELQIKAVDKAIEIQEKYCEDIQPVTLQSNRLNSEAVNMISRISSSAQSNLNELKQLKARLLGAPAIGAVRAPG